MKTVYHTISQLPTCQHLNAHDRSLLAPAAFPSPLRHPRGSDGFGTVTQKQKASLPWSQLHATAGDEWEKLLVIYSLIGFTLHKLSWNYEFRHMTHRILDWTFLHNLCSLQRQQSTGRGSVVGTRSPPYLPAVSLLLTQTIRKEKGWHKNRVLNPEQVYCKACH